MLREPTPGSYSLAFSEVKALAETAAGRRRKYGIVASTSRPANPYGHAICESFIKTRKREGICRNRHNILEPLRTNIEEFIEEC